MSGVLICVAVQDSLGGNTKTLMVAAVSPADYNYDETLSTLRYANRAKNIKNKPVINEDPKDAMLRQYKEEIDRLMQLLESQSAAGNDPGMFVPGVQPTIGESHLAPLQSATEHKDETDAKLQEAIQAAQQVCCTQSPEAIDLLWHIAFVGRCPCF